MEIKNKVVVVTGAASGIGQAVSIEMARRGAAAVAMVDMTPAIGDIAADINKELGHRVARPYQGNVTDDAFRTHVYDELCAQFSVVNVCIPAAGITRDALAVKVNRATGRAEIYPNEMFRLVTEVDLIAPIYWALELVGRMANFRLDQGMKKWDPAEGVQGAIVFIGSVSSQGNKGQIAYAASKAGLEGAAATLRKEAIFHGVRCAVIHPGFTDTPMVRALGKDYIDKHVLPSTQLGRLIRPTEIADAICFLVSNSAVSGELFADAGWHPSAA
ncbi:MAG: SDR family NAD(P)-dependent oxidoreductase [Gammaproteobacteria bacterium]